jgi:hypothetical protein
MVSLFAQLFISPPDCDTVKIPSEKVIMLPQKSAVLEYNRYLFMARPPLVEKNRLFFRSDQ